MNSSRLGLTTSIWKRSLELSGLVDLYDKVVAGERLNFHDGVRLYRSSALTAVGYLANIVRERKNGNVAYFVSNQHINYTNICSKLCRFCSFYRPPNSGDGYVLTPQQIRRRLRRHKDIPVREIHVVGGINPKLPYGYYLDILRAIKEERPETHIKAFTMIELEQIQRVARKHVDCVLSELKATGLGSCPGGGAEVFSTRVHEELFRAKLDNEGWFRIARAVHQSGLRSNVTMLYGHIETVEEKVRHLIAIRQLQDETGGFLCFVPLPFDPRRTCLSHLPQVMGEQNLREIAVARLMLDNVEHVKAFWVMLTPAVAQVALWYGADDVDGTVLRYEVAHGAHQERHGQMMSREELVRLIREAQRLPVERDALYNVVENGTMGSEEQTLA